MSTFSEGLQGNKDPKTASNCFQPTMQTRMSPSNGSGAPIEDTSNTKNKPNVMCYSNSTNVPSTQPTIEYFFQKQHNKPNMVSTAQHHIAPLERNTSLTHISSSRKPRRHSIHHYFNKIGQPLLPATSRLPTATPSLIVTQTQPEPTSESPQSPVKYDGPNPYKKKTPNT